MKKTLHHCLLTYSYKRLLNAQKQKPQKHLQTTCWQNRDGAVYQVNNLAQLIEIITPKSIGFPDGQFQVVVSNMSPAFIKGPGGKFSVAELTFDKFQFMTIINDAVKKVSCPKRRKGDQSLVGNIIFVVKILRI
ncbi:hypothetical protein [Desulfogranum marinum]|uniref:hypothetical protein n=1 Tax=Desulfogranum marinum TaxID=453220 RepID=UPI0029C8AF1B|nr:hypothetical protein [Desulfogranum marinum]